MQIRIRKHRVECIRTHYDPDRGRGRTQSLGSFSRYASVVPADLWSSLTEAEQAQLTAWLEAEKARQSIAEERHRANTLPESLRQVAAWCERPETSQEAVEALAREAWDAWSRLKQAMRKRGVTRPTP
jgi:hypothetical protein